MEKDKNGVNLLPSWCEIDLEAMFAGKDETKLEEKLQEAEELQNLKGASWQKKRQDSIQLKKYKK